MKLIITFLASFTLSIFLHGQQKCVAITMDDLFLAFGDASITKIEVACDSLMNSINKLNIPVAIFVNEKSFVKEGETDRRLYLANRWFKNPLITIGNHTYSHLNYANTELELYKEDIIRNESITKELLTKINKNLKYFRFPFNCTGKDSASKADIYKYLNDKGYIVTPFTVESEDYMYNALYCNFIKEENWRRANDILEMYIDHTINTFQYFEGVTNELYGRNINHIFLCHTNPLNAACIEKLLTRLKENGYSFISLDEALKDEIYHSKDCYNEKFGFSWIYRWIENKEERKKLMKKQPYSAEVEELYNKLMSQDQF